jgi:hypothetical protein
VVDDQGPEGQNGPPDVEFDPVVEAIVEDDDNDEAGSDDARHYLQDPNNLAENARDADEQEQDDVLDLDQTELEELGLTLDDPHQPESE